MSTNVLAWVLFLLSGLVLGSFGNVLIARIQAGEPITGRSRCIACLRTLGMSELVPVLSWLRQRGRCRGCDAEISWAYPLVESLSALLFLLAYQVSGGEPAEAFLLGVALWALLLIAVADFKTRLIPDVLSGLFVLAAAIAAFARDGNIDLIAAFVGGGFFFLQWALSRGKWVGVGDIPVGVGMGLLLGGWPLTVLALGVAYIVGSVGALPMLVSGRLKRTDHLPFVPLLFVGTVVAVMWGEMFMRGLGF
jgi:prepilin signal peptidase PulO-like enzyme (type II secretory pathway)